MSAGRRHRADQPPSGDDRRRTCPARSITMRGRKATSAFSSSVSGSIYHDGFRHSMTRARPRTRPRSPSATPREAMLRALVAGRCGTGSGGGSGSRSPRPRRSSACPIPDEAIAQMRAHLDDIDFERVAAYERRFRHDVMAHVHAFGDVAPGGEAVHPPRRDQRVRHGQRRPDPHAARSRPAARAHVIACCARWRRSRAQWRAEPTLGYTHLQPAQLTTVGKRATLWMQDLVLDLDGSRPPRRARCPSAA